MRLNKDTLNRKIEEIAQYDFDRNKVFGSAYWVYQGKETVCERYFGKTGLQNGVPVDDQTIFRLASMTKPVTAVAAMILMDRGLISLSDPVYKFLPEWENACVITLENGVETNLGASKTPPTVLHLLTHTSGIGINGEKTARITDKDLETVDATVEYFRKSGMNFEPGTKQEYSAYGAFDVMVKIIETVTKEDYGTFLQREIFAPCGMTDTVFDPSEEQWKRIITMHRRDNGENAEGKTIDGCVFCNIPSTHPLGGAGLVSTMKDYSAFAKMLLNRGTVNGNRIVSEETFALMCTPHIPKEIMKKTASWGLGVRVIADEAYPFLPVGAFGWSGAWGSHFWIDPKNDLAAVFLKNSYYDGGGDNESGKKFEEAVVTSLEE